MSALLLIGVSVAACITAVIVNLVIGLKIQNPLIQIPSALGIGAGFAWYFSYTGLAFAIVTLSPFWVIMTLAFIVGLIGLVLGKRGFLGNHAKWTLENRDGSDELNAALELLDKQEVKEISKVSADGEDFRENVIEAAGLDGHEKPGLD